MGYYDVRGPDGRLLFRFDPDRLLVETSVKGTIYTVDLTHFITATTVIVEVNPYERDDRS